MIKPRLVLAGTQSGAGKTSISSGLMAALTHRGQLVQPWKVGPDYIDPAFHAFVTGRPSRNLDSWILEENLIKHLFQATAPSLGEGISIIEGVMGLFDGHGETGQGSTAHLAQILAAPVVLIINGAAVSRSAAAMVHGYHTFQPGLPLAGVIINQVSGQTHYDILKNFIEKDTGVKCYGYLAKNPDIVLESRHLGLVPSVEVDGLKERLGRLAQAASETLDIDGLVTLAESAPAVPQISLDYISTTIAPVRIGIAQDAAFNFYYQDGLDLLRSQGAELIPFSPLEDPNLPPNLAGLYIGGGFPEMFGGKLATNQSLRLEIKEKLEQGLPGYAECGGLMYLCKTLVDHNGQSHPMVGFFPHRTKMCKRLQNFGYVTVTYDQETILGPAGTTIRAHEFHHSQIEFEGQGTQVATVRKNATRSWLGGLSHKKVLAAYPHLHFWANPKVAENFLANCRSYQREQV